MRVPRRHRFQVDASTDELFRRLPAHGRFRLAPVGTRIAFGAEPLHSVRIDPTQVPLGASLRELLPRVPTIDGEAVFPGGAVGAIDYEAGYALEGLSSAGPDAPPGWFGVFDTFAIHNVATREVEVISWGLGRTGAFDERRALDRATDLEERLRTANREPAPERDGARPPGDGTPGGAPFPSIAGSLGPAEHARGVERILDHIRCGDIYQANLTARFEVRSDVAPPDLFARLQRENPAPHAAYLETDDGTVVSCSPERLLAARGRELQTRPIKGTAPRFADPHEDRASADRLLASPKDRAELLMITDLLRNDLGKVCAPGTVHVPHLRQLESFPHVHHLVSTVHGRLAPGLDVFDALTALFPGGSITGAPKRRAMEILRDLEPVPRGIYTGTVGWVGFDRTADFNVAIRTARHRDGVYSFGAGGGIVIDSSPEAEWQELLLKTRGLALALGVNPAAAHTEKAT